jgi:hypothetical protein
MKGENTPEGEAVVSIVSRLSWGVFLKGRADFLALQAGPALTNRSRILANPIFFAPAASQHLIFHVLHIAHCPSTLVQFE